jgi:hypothetical protein
MLLLEDECVSDTTLLATLVVEDNNEVEDPMP